MKNYFKKFSIMFVMLLTVIGVGLIQNGMVANAATVGQKMTAPESGWTRYDDTDSRIGYVGTWITNNNSNYYNGIWHFCYDDNSKLVVKFNGTKFRFIGNLELAIGHRAKIINVKIDGVFDSSFSQIGSYKDQVLNYEKLGLSAGVHTIEIQLDQSQVTGTYLILDAIDIDSNGKLIPYDEAISLDKSTMNLTVGKSGQLTATTTPASVGVTWTSSDESIATVDQTGKVTAVKEGQATITATTADGLIATCIVNVIPEGQNPPPTDEPSDDGSLLIELVDGNIKTYNVDEDEVEDFIDWYEARDMDSSEKPYYQFDKGDYKDYVIHDKIDWFEVR